MHRVVKSILSVLFAVLFGSAIFVFSAQASDSTQWSTQAERDAQALLPPGTVDRTVSGVSPPKTGDILPLVDRQIQRAVWNQLRDAEREHRRNQLRQNIRQRIRDRRNGNGRNLTTAEAATADEQQSDGLPQTARNFDLRRQTETRLAINSVNADAGGVGTPNETPTPDRIDRPDNTRTAIFRPPADDASTVTPIGGGDNRPPDDRLGGNDRPSPVDDGGTGSTRPPGRRNTGR